MDPDHFQSAKFKLRRANQHLKELNKFLEEFFTAKTGFIVSSDKQNHQYTLRVETVGERIPPEASLILGDLIHNIRTAFDHVVVSFTKSKDNKMAMPVGKTLTDLDLLP